jgi:NADH-quinone oxidoreductase subunit L
MAALMGLPLTTGFLSKEAVLAAGYGSQPWLSLVLLMAGLLTGAYMGRYFFWAFLKTKNAHQQLSPNMRLPLAALAVCVLIPLGMAQYGVHSNSLTFFNIGFLHVPAPEAPVWFTVLAVGLSLVGFALGFWLQTRIQPEIAKQATVPTWASTGFYIHSMWQGVYRMMGVKLPSRIAWADWHVLDRMLRASGKSVVVLGHLVAFLDNKLVDSIILLIAAISRLGGRLVNSFQTASIQRNLAHLFIFILLFSWLVYQLVF